MDDPADRVDLRGLRLLDRSRALRCDAAARVVAEAARQLDAAEAGAREADTRLSEHHAAWRAQEAATLAAMAGGSVAGLRFRARSDALERMADRAIMLRRRLEEAGARAGQARATLAAARAALLREQRRRRQGDAVIVRVTGLREAAAAMREEQALDDDLALRRSSAPRVVTAPGAGPLG